jgi:hypothetical protein
VFNYAYQFLAYFIIVLTAWLGHGYDLHGSQGETDIGALQRLSIDDSDDRMVVTLIADRPLDGTLERIDGLRPRVFIDLIYIVPEVVRATEVNQGGVVRVRVGLNQPDPPITRVVLDLQDGTSATLEQGVNDRELRIIVLPETAINTAVESMQQTDNYKEWFQRITNTMLRLLVDDASMQLASITTNELAQQERILIAWNAAQQEIESIEPPTLFVSSHDLLVTAGVLGQVVMSSRRDDRFTEMDTFAANTGTAMLVKQALIKYYVSARFIQKNP